MAAADINRNFARDERSQLSTSRHRDFRPECRIRQWKTQQELFQVYWNLGPGPARDAQFWTPQAVGERIERTEARVRGMCDEGRLPMVKVGGRIYIHIPSLLEAGSFMEPDV
jgi:hypothetical protein